jgi:hypothetical protein
MQKNATSYCYFKYAEFAGICQTKHVHDQQKKRSKNMTKYAEKMQYRHPPIQEHVVYSHLDFIFLYI